MLQKMIVALLMVALSACVPIPTTPPQVADCPGGYLHMLAGQSANDPVATDLPGYVDIVKAESILDGETLTATFYLRDVPETMNFSRKGMYHTGFEYTYAVHISTEGEPLLSQFDADYTLVSFYTAYSPQKSAGDTTPITDQFQNVARTVLWENEYREEEITIYFHTASTDIELAVSPERNTLTLTGEIPGITEESTIMFTTEDFLSGQDGVSCNPGRN